MFLSFEFVVIVVFVFKFFVSFFCICRRSSISIFE